MKHFKITKQHECNKEALYQGDNGDDLWQMVMLRLYSWWKSSQRSLVPSVMRKSFDFSIIISKHSINEIMSKRAATNGDNHTDRNLFILSVVSPSSEEMITVPLPSSIITSAEIMLRAPRSTFSSKNCTLVCDTFSTITTYPNSKERKETDPWHIEPTTGSKSWSLKRHPYFRLRRTHVTLGIGLIKSRRGDYFVQGVRLAVQVHL